MSREAIRELGRGQFDILVVGGGITGTGVAMDAALRGHRVALVEKDDFASGTSSRSSRLIHGGIRYLENGQVGMVLESVRERETLLRIAPGLVKSLAFTWPVYKHSRVGKYKLNAGLWIYDALARSSKERRHKSLSAKEVMSREPSLLNDGLTGGAFYCDAATSDTRLVLANALGAADCEAVVVNHAKLMAKGKRAGEWVVKDQISGASVTVRAKVVVMATGAWQGRGTKGVHIAVPRARIGNSDAITLLAPQDGRVMFVLPHTRSFHPERRADPMSWPRSDGKERRKARAEAYDDLAIIGTTDTFSEESPDEVRAEGKDIEYLLESANFYFPDAALTRDDVVSAWAGLRPMIGANGQKNAGRIPREHAIFEEDGVIRVMGGKMTTYRAMAEEIVDRCEQTTGKKGKCLTAQVNLESPGRALGIREIEDRDPTLKRRIVTELPYTMSEVVFACECEMAQTVGDVLIRRLGLAFEQKDNGRAVAGAVAAVMANRMGWGPGEVERQVAAYKTETRRIFGGKAESGSKGKAAKIKAPGKART